VYLTRKSGESFPAIFSRYPILDTQGNLAGTLGVAVDISQRKQVEQALKFANSELRQLFNTAVDGMRVIDKNHNMLRISDSFVKLCGTSREKARGKKCYEVLSGSLCHTPMCPLTLTLHGDELVEYEVVKERCDGIKIPCILTATPFKAPDGELLGIVEHFKDITLREKAYESLKKSERKYSTVVENSLTGIYVETDGKIIFVNKRFSEIFGCNKDDLIGMDIETLIHPDYLPLVQEIRSKLLHREENLAEFEIKCLTLDNQTIWAKIRDTLIEYEGQTAILGNLVDTTERKHMEEALRESEKTLKILSSHLFTAQEDERKRLAYELHDGIGQSLSAIKFCTETLQSQFGEYADAKDNSSLRKIISLTQNAIEEVRKISMDLRPSTLDDLGILATIAWFCREFQSIYSSIHIESKIDIKEQEVPDSIKTVIFRVIQEALNNVGRHSKADYVRLSLRKTEGHIEFIVEDNGIGFDLTETHATRSLVKGFGLAGMRERVEFSGGIFIVMSMKGAGTFIRARWPI
jgi:PAS domain S-box-containing protein